VREKNFSFFFFFFFFDEIEVLQHQFSTHSALVGRVYSQSAHQTEQSEATASRHSRLEFEHFAIEHSQSLFATALSIRSND
jgi:hypothetical protein